MDQTPDKRNTNLARIRDNQRRSRARRKEYLAELETKYRACEQTGIEASAEIQAAARKVVDENRRLRQLLKQQGLSDREISSISSDSVEGSTANELEALIGVRRRCGPGTACGPGMVCGEGGDSRTQSCSSVSPTVSAKQEDGERKVQMQNYGSATNSSGGTTLLRTSTATTPGHMHPYSPYPPLPMAAVASNYAAPFDESFNWHDDMGASHDFLAPPSLPATSDSSSCSVAASAIRSVQPGLGRELERELGCEEGEECSVPNAYIFQVMDRYSSVS